MVMLKRVFRSKLLAVIAAEIVLLIIGMLYFAGAGYSQEELTFTQDDMQLQDIGRRYSDGAYADASYTDIKAVVTPKVRLKKGIYFITAGYTEKGIARAGLIYEEVRTGKELVDEDEFTVDPEKNSLSYRVRIRNDSDYRFKLRLTGDAADGDYIILEHVSIVPSKLTYIYPLVCMALFFLFADLLVWGYLRYFRFYDPERKTVLVVLAFTAFFMGLPMYRNGLSEPINMDLKFHLQRMEGLYRGLLSGQFPVKIQPEWLDGNGYASSVFYGDILLYFPAVLRMMGATLQDAYKCYVEAVNIAIVFVSYYAFRRITKNETAALAGSVLYAGSTTNLSLIYTTTMVGGYSALIFYPLVIAGFYEAFTIDVKSREYKRIWVLLTVGFTGLLMTHMISCLILGVYAILCCLLMIKKVFRRETLCEFLKAAGAAIALNLWFLVPFLHYMLSEKLRINHELGKEIIYSDYRVGLSDFLEKGGGRSIYHLFLHPDYHIDLAILFILIFYVASIPIRKEGLLTKSSRVVFSFAVFGFWTCTDLFPIVRISELIPPFYKYFSTLQYQYRFFNIAIAIAACLGAMVFAMDIFEKKIVYGMIGLLCCFVLYQDFQYFGQVGTESVYLDYIDLEIWDDYQMGKAEYLPVETDMGKLTDEVEYDEALEVEQIDRKYLSFDLSVTNQTEEERQILLPVLYYSGYRTYDVQSRERLETVVGDNGRVTVKIPAHYAGTFHTAFREPWHWRAAEAVSLLTCLLLLLYAKREVFKKYFRKGALQYGD